MVRVEEQQERRIAERLALSSGIGSPSIRSQAMSLIPVP
jgi:hypothetical protein